MTTVPEEDEEGEDNADEFAWMMSHPRAASQIRDQAGWLRQACAAARMR